MRTLDEGIRAVFRGPQTPAIPVAARFNTLDIIRSQTFYQQTEFDLPFAYLNAIRNSWGFPLVKREDVYHPDSRLFTVLR